MRLPRQCLAALVPRKGLLVIAYRTFQNTDPPNVATIWNEAFTGRSAVQLRHSTPLETYVFAKQHFDPAGLVIAWDGAVPVGFAHAGFGQNATGGSAANDSGGICLIGVRPSHRRRGIGSELLRRCEKYLADKGARTWVAGPHAPLDPFYFGLYGGSNLPGFLISDAEAEPFLKHNGYQAKDLTLVLQRVLGVPLAAVDGRFPTLRRQYDVRIVPRGGKMSRWQESVVGPVELVDFQLDAKGTGLAAGRCCLWEMDLFGGRWNQSAIGIVDIEITPALRRQGMARYLLFQTLRYLQDQYFALAEAQIAATNIEALNLFQGIGFVQVDTGRTYIKNREG
jgi:ribosomal protein S18 acetylase RimI-like enzyme